MKDAKWMRKMNRQWLIRVIIYLLSFRMLEYLCAMERHPLLYVVIFCIIVTVVDVIHIVQNRSIIKKLGDLEYVEKDVVHKEALVHIVMDILFMIMMLIFCFVCWFAA